MCDDDQSNWDEKINTVLMGYRASCQASTKHSPYFMLFQQNMRLPIDSEVQSPAAATDEEQEVDIDSVIQALIASRDRVFQKAESCITSERDI